MKTKQVSFLFGMGILSMITLNAVGVEAIRPQKKKTENKTKNSLTPEGKYLMMRMHQDSHLKESRNTLMTLNRPDFWELVASSPKNYSTVVLFLDFSLESCSKVCEQAMSKLQDAASIHYFQYRMDSKKLREEALPLFFVTVNINQKRNELKKFGVDVTIPNFVFFPASTTLKYVPFQKMPFNFKSLLDDSAPIPDTIVDRWISEVTGVFLDGRKFSGSMNSDNKFNYLMIVFIAVNILFMVYKKEGVDKLMSDLKNVSWAKVIVGLVLWLISGQMFNIIRSTPIIARGSFWLISKGSRDQCTLETCIVMTFYGLITMGMIRLIEIKADSEDFREKTKRTCTSKQDTEKEFLLGVTLPLVIGLYGIVFMYNYKMN